VAQPRREMEEGSPPALTTPLPPPPFFSPKTTQTGLEHDFFLSCPQVQISALTMQISLEKYSIPTLSFLSLLSFPKSNTPSSYKMKEKDPCGVAPGTQLVRPSSLLFFFQQTHLDKKDGMIRIVETRWIVCFSPFLPFFSFRHTRTSMGGSAGGSSSLNSTILGDSLSFPPPFFFFPEFGCRSPRRPQRHELYKSRHQIYSL